VNTGRMITAGKWPCEKNSKPIHLYVDGVVILFGGMAINPNNKVRYKSSMSAKNDNVTHQIAHTDFSNGKFSLCKKNPLLAGLTLPFTVNCPLEDWREVYIREPHTVGNIIRAKKSDILVVGGDTFHGGCTYLLERGAKHFRYHPAIHFVFESRRFRKKEEFVNVTDGKEMYTGAEHTGTFKNQDLLDSIPAAKKKFEALIAAGNEEGREEVYEAVQQALTELAMLGRDAKQNRRKRAEEKQRGKRKRNAKESNPMSNPVRRQRNK
jgi:hypothetical protein